MSRITTNIVWNGPACSAAITNRFQGRLRQAILVYYTELRHAISRWGSAPIGGGLRRTFEHSNPGDPPLKQTENLYNSIRVDISAYDGYQITAECSTDAEYANTLELGGALQVDQDTQKPHTGWRLIHPIPNGMVITIAPRPAWLPTFRRTVRDMIRIISR